MAISFACRPFNLDEIVRCGLQLSRSEMRVFLQCLKSDEFAVAKMAQELGIDRTTVQKAVGKLYEKGLLRRIQRNRTSGGYQYAYAPLPKDEVRKRVKEIARTWFIEVESSLERWP